jgi:hypothetical protein
MHENIGAILAPNESVSFAVVKLFDPTDKTFSTHTIFLPYDPRAT